jgi:hypothetical protein
MAYRAKQGDNKCTRGSLYASWRHIIETTKFDSVKKLQNLIFCDFWYVRDKTVQVKLTSNLSSTAIKSSCIDMNQSVIESLDNVLSYAYSSVAIVSLVHKL